MILTGRLPNGAASVAAVRTISSTRAPASTAGLLR
ncbi:hypothetical protein Aros01_03181 [Streptosporangium roseum]|uniref:Uncharacterized protein n=1 Tax=Streptosporangium roseum (strain ATCC 12428 / DSM 43021 / JCM 3005 / KCTC 9067 / NCIMB 10171 / NRRL 2505 / NI 9100) TaxID=479432 RepID=D2B0Z3_STRRD|nr:hypothetical protein Sros_0369 [Streptosporangium roseum DSM 43021]